MKDCKKVIVALDGCSKEKSLEVAEQLSGLVWGFKVNDLLVECGVSIVKDLKKYGNVLQIQNSMTFQILSQIR